jgi:hypothetical protein
VFVGGGTGKAEVERLVQAGVPNVMSLPYQPRETLGTGLAAADLQALGRRAAEAVAGRWSRAALRGAVCDLLEPGSPAASPGRTKPPR